MLSLSLRLLIQVFPVFLVSCPIPDFYANIPCYLGFYARYRMWCAAGGEGGGALGGLEESLASYVFLAGRAV